MSEPVRLSSPLVRVRRSRDDEPFDVQTGNPDLIRWDETRTKHKWPKYDEAPFLWITFIAWSASRRENLVGPEVTWEIWKSTTMEISAVDPDEDDETGSPTPPGPGPG